MKIAFIFSVMILGVVFLIVPNGEPYDFFPYAQMKVTGEWYVYYILQHLIFIFFALFLVMETDDYPKSTFVFFLLQIGELIDFLLTYNTTWFEVRGWPVTFNVLKVFVFLLAVSYEFLCNFFAAE